MNLEAKPNCVLCVRNHHLELLGSGRCVLSAHGLLHRRRSLKLRQADVHQRSVWDLENPSSDFSIFSVFLCYSFS